MTTSPEEFKWYRISEKVPEPNTLVLIKRKGKNYYVIGRYYFFKSHDEEDDPSRWCWLTQHSCIYTAQVEDAWMEFFPFKEEVVYS